MSGIKKFLSIGFLSLTFATVLAVPHENKGRYLYEQDISSTGAFIARWTPDVENSVIYFEFEAQTQGWVGVSILLPDIVDQVGDQVIAGVYEDGTSYIQDRYFNKSIPHPERPLRPIDVQQDWVLHYAEEANDKTIVGVSRPFNTGDFYDGPVFEDISSTGAFIARWTPDVENNKIHFEFEAQTLGWVGVSILRQTTEGQIGDQVIAGVYEDGTSYIQDRYFNTSIPHPERPLRPIDVQQDWVLRYAEERNDKTIVGVSRPLDTGDLYDGPVIEDIVLKLSWAYDELDITDGIAPDHGPTFGAVYVNFLNPEI